MSLTNGLVAYYRLDGDTLDSSGNGRHSTYMPIGGENYTNCKDNWLNNGAFKKYIDMLGNITFPNEITVSMWIKVINNNAGTYHLLYKGFPHRGFDLSIVNTCPSYYSQDSGWFMPPQTNGNIELTRYSNNTVDLDHTKVTSIKTNVPRNNYSKIKLSFHGGGSNIDVNSDYIDTSFLLDNGDNGNFSQENNWKHVVFTASNITKKAKLYINGIKIFEYTSPYANLYQDDFTSDQLRIGNSDQYMAIDEVRVYNRAVADGDINIGQKATSEIEELYNSDIYDGYTIPYSSLSVPKITPYTNNFIGEARINTICDDGAYKICYTIDGSEPTYNSSYVNPRECIKLDTSCTLKIKKFITSNIYSDTVTKTINITNVSDINQSLIARYKFDNSLEDFTDNHYDLSPINSWIPIYGNDKDGNLNKCLNITWNQKGVGSSETQLYLLNTRFAISFWLKAEELTSDNTFPIFLLGGKNGYIPSDALLDKFNVYKVYKNGASKLVFDMRFDRLSEYEETPKTYSPNPIEVSGYTDNTWKHIVINYVNNMLYVFINKVCVGFTAFTGSLKDLGNIFFIGNGCHGIGTDYIDDLRLYNRPLKVGVNDIELNTIAQSEIETLYNMGVNSINLQIPYTNNNTFEFIDNTSVDLISPDNAPIYYTLDGSTPNVTSLLYSTPIVITETTTIKVICIRVGDNDSPILTLNYTKKSTELLESDIEKIQNISSNNVVIEIEKNGNKIILSEFNSNSNLAFFIKQEYIENKYPLYNNVNNRKISLNDCYLELEIPFIKDNLKLFEVLDFDIDNYAYQSVIKKDNNEVSVNIHPIYKGSDRYFDIELPSCDYTVDITYNLSFNSVKTIKLSLLPKPYKVYLVNDFDNINISNISGGNLLDGNYEYSIQYLNRFSKGELSVFKNITSLDNSKNKIIIKEIPRSVEDIVIWKKKDSILQGYYILSKSEIKNKEFIDDGNKIFKSFSGDINSFNNNLYYYNLLKFGK